jgi:hypothetical protein
MLERWRRHFPPKRRLTFGRLHGIISEHSTLHFQFVGLFSLRKECQNPPFAYPNSPVSLTGNGNNEPSCIHAIVTCVHKHEARDVHRWARVQVHDVQTSCRNTNVDRDAVLLGYRAWPTSIQGRVSWNAECNEVKCVAWECV